MFHTFGLNWTLRGLARLFRACLVVSVFVCLCPLVFALVRSCPLLAHSRKQMYVLVRVRVLWRLLVFDV